MYHRATSQVDTKIECVYYDAIWYYIMLGDYNL